MDGLGKGGALLVHLNYLRENFEKIKREFPNCETLFMIKADAYGHGAERIASFSYEELGIKEFGLASLSEALLLRNKLPEMRAELYVFSDLELDLANAKEAYLEKRILPVLSHKEDLLSLIADSDFNNLPLVLKFNTGMNRLGFGYDEVEEIINLLKQYGRNEVFHLMTHFANGSLSMKTNKRNNLQWERFQKLKEIFLNHGIEIRHSSIGNSGAIEQGIGKEETHIRPGLMMFGPSSLAPQYKDQGWFKGKVISELNAKVINVFPVKKGDPLGYGSTPCGEDGVVAIIEMGYGDGLTTHYRKATFHHKGMEAKVCARVCMDMTYLLFPVGAQLKRGDEITLWGENPDEFENLSTQINSLPYELVIQLTTRVPRIYQLD